MGDHTSAFEPLTVIDDGAKRDGDYVHIEPDRESGPRLVMAFDCGYASVSSPLRDILVWCLGPGREVLAANGLVILGGSVAP